MQDSADVKITFYVILCVQINSENMISHSQHKIYDNNNEHSVKLGLKLDLHLGQNDSIN